MPPKNKKIGRPPKWASPEILSTKITAYFKECEEQKKLPTKGGMALYLDTTRDVLGDYEDRGDSFSNSIKRAYEVIEEAWVQRLTTHQQVTGPIFYLKNAFAFRDRSEQDITSGGEKLGIIQLPQRNIKKDDQLETTKETGNSSRKD